MDLKLTSKESSWEEEIDWTDSTSLSLTGVVDADKIQATVTLRRNKRGAQLEIRPDTDSLKFSAYDEPGKFAYRKPVGWNALVGGKLFIDNLPVATLEWGQASAYPSEKKPGWVFATVPVLVSNLSHEDTDPLFDLMGIESYEDLHEE